jgi:hypothetical protein
MIISLNNRNPSKKEEGKKERIVREKHYKKTFDSNSNQKQVIQQK